MKKPPIGLGPLPCAVCGFPDPEVKEDKNGFAYIHCDCTSQTFTREPHRDSLLRTRMRPLPTASPAAAPPVSVTVPANPIKAGPIPVPPVPTPPPRASWLAITTLLDRKTS